MRRVPFSEMLHEQHYNKHIIVKCFVSGKSISPYAVPKTIKIKCAGDRDKKCKGESQCEYCNRKVSFEGKYVEMLKFIGVPESYFKNILKSSFKLSCSFAFEIIDVQNIERIFVTAPTGKERIRNVGNYVCYNFGLGIDVNVIYELNGFSTTDPNTQTGTCIFIDSRKLKSDIETFSLKKSRSGLEEFQIENVTEDKIYLFLEQLYEYYARNVTKIYGRFHLHLAVDMAFRSPISFNMGTDKVHKGWTDIMIIGDTRCGKGYVSEKLVEYFNVGETISGDNTSYSGLVGGIDQYDKHRVISWGKIPINDQGLVVIDEAGEIKPEDWGRLSRVRSEGIAEIVKIQKQITNARTRLIFLANPPLKTISSYSYGIQSLLDVVKAPEDIARFDYVLVVSHDEVSVDDINQQRTEISRPMFSSKLEQDLIMWVWSRKHNQIHFSTKAIDAIYERSKELAKKYSFSIPLIQGENVRIKIAKLAVCFAGRVFSNKNNGETLLVNRVHVDCAFAFFNVIYKLEANGYSDYSIIQREVDRGASPEDLKRVDKYFKSFTNSRLRLMKSLFQSVTINLRDLVEQVNVSDEIARECISKLNEMKLIVKIPSSNYYRKNPGFNKWLKAKIIPHEMADRGSSYGEVHDK